MAAVDSKDENSKDEAVGEPTSFSTDFTKLESLGQGAFSTVHRCRLKSSQGEYAVKCIALRPLRLQPTFNLKRLMRECDILRKVEHKNIVKFHWAFEESDQIFFVMDYVDGIELFDLILARSRFSDGDAIPVLRQLAEALAFLHAKGIIHRDVKVCWLCHPPFTKSLSHSVPASNAHLLWHSHLIPSASVR